MTLPDWLDPLYEAAEMRAVDAWAIEQQGVPSLDLMERAGVGLARVTAALARPGPVASSRGKGNNGGDGLVAARLLRAEGGRCDVLAAADLDGLRGDARANLERLPGPAPQPFAPELLDGSGVVVDALLGTGFEGEPREPLASAIAAINAQDAPVVACDVPSGIDAASGEVQGEAVRATGHRDLPRPQARPLRRARQGPRRHGARARHRHPARGAQRPGRRTDRRARADALSTRGSAAAASSRPAWSWWSAARAGSPARRRMAARSAQRAGAGYVQVAVPASVQPAVDAAPAGADEPWPARRGRLPHAGGRRAGAAAGRARGRGGARAGARPGRGRPGIRPRAWPAASR